MTVAGPVASGQLGVTLPHEHVLIDMFKVNGNRYSRLDDLAQMEVEIGRFRDAGGGCLVDVTPRNTGRDPAGLRHLAEATGLHVVMGTGWYRERWYEPEVTRMSVGECAQILVDEIERGVDGVRPGIIGEIGTDNAWISPLEERGFRAAARAHLATGLTVTTHAYASPVGITQLELLTGEEKVDPGRVIIGHCDTYWDPAYHLSLAALGAWVQFDTARVVNEWEFTRRAVAIEALIGAGYGHHVLLSQDICEQPFLATNGGAGYDCLLRSFIPFLLGRGVVSPEEAEMITTANAQTALHSRPVPW
jgi:phosphotriesterase-related protein